MIHLYCGQKQHIWLGEVEHMESLLALIRHHINDGVQVIIKHSRINWGNAAIFGFLFGICSSMLGMGIAYGLQQIKANYPYFSAFSIVGLVNIALGGYQLVYQPQSKNNPRHKKSDLLMGIILIIAGLLLLFTGIVDEI